MRVAPEKCDPLQVRTSAMSFIFRRNHKSQVLADLAGREVAARRAIRNRGYSTAPHRTATRGRLARVSPQTPGGTPPHRRGSADQSRPGSRDSAGETPWRSRALGPSLFAIGIEGAALLRMPSSRPTSRQAALLEMPSLYMRSNSAIRKGGATLFLTTLTRTLPADRLASLLDLVDARMSRRTEA